MFLLDPVSSSLSHRAFSRRRNTFRRPRLLSTIIDQSVESVRMDVPAPSRSSYILSRSAPVILYESSFPVSESGSPCTTVTFPVSASSVNVPLMRLSYILFMTVREQENSPQLSPEMCASILLMNSHAAGFTSDLFTIAKSVTGRSMTPFPSVSGLPVRLMSKPRNFLQAAR